MNGVGTVFEKVDEGERSGAEIRIIFEIAEICLHPFTNYINNSEEMRREKYVIWYLSCTATLESLDSKSRNLIDVTISSDEI